MTAENAIETQGLLLPRLGLGTFRMQGDACREAVAHALTLGYRHIDTAEMYGNEDAVGAAIADAKIARGDIHLTTKVWHENLTPDAIRRAFDASRTRLKTDYVDFYLVHWPSPGMNLAAAMETMMRIRDDGGAKAIGVCNFPVALLRQAIEEIGAPIACNQVEYHVLLDQSRLYAYARSKNVPLVAYAPLAQGRLAEHPSLTAIAARHNATPAQVALNWLLSQEGVAAIPKARQPASQYSNLAALDIRLDDNDLAAIAALPKNQRFVNPGFAPEWD